MEMKKCALVSLLLLIAVSYPSISAGAVLSEDFEGMTVGDPITNYTGWSISGGGAGAFNAVVGNGSYQITTDNYLELGGSYPKSSNYWDWVNCDLSAVSLSGNSLTYSVDVNTNLVAGQYWGKRVRFGIADAAGSLLAYVEMLDFNSNLKFNDVVYPGLSNIMQNYVFNFDFAADTVQLTRDGSVIGSESLLGGDRSISDAQKLIFGTGGYFTNNTRNTLLQADNISLVVPEPTTMVLLALGGLAAWRRRRIM